MIQFTKMHGLQNDFVVVDGPVEPSLELVRAMCHRRAGIGADGLLAVSASPDTGRVRMQYWNADGSEAEMCGNGLRCVANYARKIGLVGDDAFVVDTPVGPRAVVVTDRDTVSVDLGPASVGESFDLEGRSWTKVDVGNPHVVTAVADPADVEVAVEGPRIERDPMFPTGTNVEFVRVEGDRIDMRVWERGVGETLACGTGMVAVAAAAMAADPARTTWSVHVPGGRGGVRFENGASWLTGPVATVFTGEWDPQ